MTRVIDQITAHFSTKEEKIIEVPEWGNEDGSLYIYCSPLTLAQKNRLYKMAKDDDLGLMVEALIMKARDNEGNPLFSRADKPDLMRSCDPEVLIRVANNIMDIGDGDEDMSNKNINNLKKN